MNTPESPYIQDIPASSIAHIVLQKYAKYNTKTWQYILEVAENIYNILELDTERWLKYFVYNKTTEYILLEWLLRTIQIHGQVSKPTWNLTPLEKDIYKWVDAKICINCKTLSGCVGTDYEYTVYVTKHVRIIITFSYTCTNLLKSLLFRGKRYIHSIVKRWEKQNENIKKNIMKYSLCTTTYIPIRYVR
jgi:hypothetical protein